MGKLTLDYARALKFIKEDEITGFKEEVKLAHDIYVIK